MNITISKADVASLACDGCKKKYICNLASKMDENGQSFLIREFIQSKLGMELPLQDPPAIFKDAGSEGEKQVLLHLLRNHNCSIFSMSEESADVKINTSAVRDRFKDKCLQLPYICFAPAGISVLKEMDAAAIGKCRYKTETKESVRNLALLAERVLQDSNAVMYIYQMSFAPDISMLAERLFPNRDIISVYKDNKIEVSEQRPDLLRVLARQSSYLVLDSYLNQAESDGSKYILEVCDIKTSEFSSTFFFELGFYMILLKLWIDSNGLNEMFDVSYKAEIIPFDVVSNSVRAETWKMDFSLVRDKMMTVFTKTLPECILAVESGDQSIIREVKCSAKCQVCDYYGGQFEGKLYDKLHRQSPDNEIYKTYIQDPKHNYCRYYMNSVQNINILPGLKPSDITYLQNKGIRDLLSLKNGLKSHAFKDHAELMSKSEGLLHEIAVHGTKKAEAKVKATKSIGALPPQLKIFTLIRQDSQHRALCYGISYNVYVKNVDSDTLAQDMNVTDGYLNEYKASEFLMEIDSPDRASKLKALVAYIRAMHTLLTRFENVRWIDSYGNLHPVTYGIFYWGKKTFDAFKVNLQELLEYLIEKNDDLTDLYPELPQKEVEVIARDIKEAVQAYADLFADDRVTYYEKVLKSPLYDLQAIYKEVAAVDSNFSYNLIDIYNVVCGEDVKNPYYRPDSDNYSTYVYDGWFSIDRETDPDKKAREQKKFEKLDRQHLYYLSILLDKLYKKDKRNPFIDIIKKGEFPVVGTRQKEETIEDSRMLLVYLYQRLNAAYDQVENENAHVAPDLKKQYDGTCIHIERELTEYEINKKALHLSPLQRAYRISRIADNANMDEGTFGLTVYPVDNFTDTFKKIISSRKDYAGCLNVDVRLGRYDNCKPYTQLISCNISHIDIANYVLVLEYKEGNDYTAGALEIMDALERIHGFDFSKNLYLERVHSDFWSDRLRKTIIKLENDCRNALDILQNPVLRHEKIFTPADVSKSLRSLTKIDAGIKLDDSQLHAISTMFNDNITLLWGPPGTGKSHTLAHYILLELQKRSECKMLLMGNYNATDNLLNSLLKSIREYDNCAGICRKLDIIRLCSSGRVMENLMFVENEFFSTADQVCDYKAEKGSRLGLENDRPFVIITSTPNQMARLTYENFEKSLIEIDKFDIVIIDEASQMDVGHFLPALLRIEADGKKHSKFIIAGDDKQLQPVHKKEITGSEAIWFGSVYNYFKNYKDASGKQVFVPAALEISRRSNHCIIDFIREAFDYNTSFQSFEGKANTCVSYLTEPDNSSILYTETLRSETGLALLVYDDGLSSKRNEFEIEQICKYVRKIWECKLTDVGHDLRKFFASGVGIVVPHTAQRTAIRKKLFADFKEILSSGQSPEAVVYSEEEISEITAGAVDTVERFQGQERDIILAGYVVGNEDAIANEERFIYDRCRMNVIISRAKYKAIVMASRELMNNISNDLEIIELQKAFQKLKDYCDSKTFYVDEPGWKEKRGQAYIKYI